LIPLLAPLALLELLALLVLFALLTSLTLLALFALLALYAPFLGTKMEIGTKALPRNVMIYVAKQSPHLHPTSADAALGSSDPFFKRKWLSD